MAKKKAKKATPKAAKRKASAGKARKAPARKAARKAPPRRAAAKARKPARAVARKAKPAKKGTVVAAPKRASAAKKPAAKKAIAAKKPAVKKAKALTPVRREDHAGHLDPKYVADLRARSDRPPRDPESFVDKPRASDTLVEELGEGFVGSATSGEYEAEDKQNADVSEEVGGPFVQTTGDQEFARGTDASNPKGATREPFPRT